MDEHKGQGSRDASHLPHGHRDRDSSHEQPRKGETKTAEGGHDPDSDSLEADETFQPDRDGTHS